MSAGSHDAVERARFSERSRCTLGKRAVRVRYSQTAFIQLGLRRQERWASSGPMGPARRIPGGRGGRRRRLGAPRRRCGGSSRGAPMRRPGGPRQWGWAGGDGLCQSGSRSLWSARRHGRGDRISVGMGEYSSRVGRRPTAGVSVMPSQGPFE